MVVSDSALNELSLGQIYRDVYFSQLTVIYFIIIIAYCDQSGENFQYSLFFRKILKNIIHEQLVLKNSTLKESLWFVSLVVMNLTELSFLFLQI